MVDKCRPPQTGSSPGTPQTRSRPLHGQLRERLGGITRCQTSHTGCLVTQGDEAKHKLEGIRGSAPLNPPLSAPPPEETRTSHVGQLDSCTVSSEGRWHQSPSSLYKSLGYSESGGRDVYDTHHQTYSGEGEHPSGSVEQTGSDTHRVEVETGGVQGSFIPQWGTYDRPICISSQSSATHVCESVSRSPGLRPGCSVTRLGRPPSPLCIPTVTNTTPSPEEDKRQSVHDGGDSSGMAPPIMVPRASKPVSGQPSLSPVIPDLFTAQGVKTSLPPKKKSSSVFVPCLEVIRTDLSKRGFSTKVAEGIAQPQRNSTLDVYAPRWLEFNRWCTEQSLDPLQATIPVICDFLMFLYEERRNKKGGHLAISTIKGYRSALASTLPIGKLISHSEEISKLMSFFEKNRPRTKELTPQWSLSLVLHFLADKPFEPIMQIPMDLLTKKTVFLLSFASARRCSEIHALSCDPRCCRFQAGLTEVVLLTEPGFLAKNESHNHNPSPIVIPGLTQHVGRSEKDHFLCPVRALKSYVERTNDPDIRKGVTKLFIRLDGKLDANGKPVLVTRADIARWMTDTVKMALHQSSSDSQAVARITAHEVRKQSSSWAKYNQVPMQDIMRAALWRGKSTFHDFYLKNMAAESDGLYSLGPIVAAQSVIVPPRPAYAKRGNRPDSHH